MPRSIFSVDSTTKTIILIKTPSIHVIQSNAMQKMRSNNKIQIEKRKRIQLFV